MDKSATKVIEHEMKRLGFSFVEAKVVWFDMTCPRGVLADTQPMPNDQGKLEFKITYYMPTLLKMVTQRDADLDTELLDTVRHECAHVAHIRSLEDQMDQIAKAELAMLTSSTYSSAFRFPMKMVKHDAFNRVMMGKNSFHGTGWKKFARAFGADPRASR